METIARELNITRIFNAPRELVWKAWTDQKQLAQWWGPKGFTNPVCQWDAKTGGKIHVDMKGPDGIVYPMGGEFGEIIKPEKLVFTSPALDTNGKPIFVIHNTITFIAEGNKTKVMIHAVVMEATAEAPQYLKGWNEGWNQSLDKLANLLGK
jgi:uncharacterized protein YndB with AHSA1/START domain